MAYNRAPREDLLEKSQTGPDVSPNSYQKTYDPLCSCGGTNWAPFLVSSKRKYAFSSSTTPAPNAYYPKIQKKILGGASMLYTEKRFKGGHSQTPAAIEYDPYREGEELDNRSPPRPNGFLYHCHTPYTIKGYCPSIPRSWHKGYESLPDGTLVECCYSEKDTNTGPDFYNASYHTFGTCYRGPYWSRYSARKVDLKSDIPGVGTYDIQEKPNELQQFLLKIRGEREKNSCLLRYMEKLQSEALRNNYPAPNQYSVWKPKDCLCVKKRLVPKTPSEIQECEHTFIPFTTPAPNAYTDPRTAFWYLKKPSCVKELNAFLVNSPRFKKAKKDVSPAPNQYELRSFVDEMKGKISPYAVRDKVAFDTAVPKKLYYLPPDYPPIILKKPCKCTSYPREPEPPVPPPHPTYPFASKTKRFKTLDINYEASPASYNITESFKSISDRKSFRKAKKYHFLFGNKRFGKITNFGLEEDKSYIPFLQYNLRSEPLGKSFNSGETFNRGKRFSTDRKDLPGPLDYVVPRFPSNRTYNVTLNPPLLTPYQLYKMKTRPRTFEPPLVPRQNAIFEQVCPNSLAKIQIGFEETDPKQNLEKSLNTENSVFTLQSLEI